MFQNDDTKQYLFLSLSHDINISEWAPCPWPRMHHSSPYLMFTPSNIYGLCCPLLLSSLSGDTLTPGVSSSFSWLFFGLPPICIHNFGIEAKNTFVSTGVLLKLLLLKSRTQTNVISEAWKLPEGSPGKQRCTNRLLKHCRYVLSHYGRGLSTGKAYRRSTVWRVWLVSLVMWSFCRFLLLLPVSWLLGF